MAGLLRIVSHLFSPRGRSARRGYWLGFALIIALILLLMPIAQSIGGRWAVVVGFLPLYWLAYCLMSRRCHDVGRSAAWLLLLLVPVIGLICGVAVLGFRRGDPGSNQYGPDPRPPAPDYLVVKAIS